MYRLGTYWLLLIFMHRRRVSNTASRASAHTGEASSASVHRCDQCASPQDATTTHAASQQLGWCTVDFGFSRNKSSLTTYFTGNHAVQYYCTGAYITLSITVVHVAHMMSYSYAQPWTIRHRERLQSIIKRIDPWTLILLSVITAVCSGLFWRSKMSRIRVI